jgi:GNAT superfamily N-acetyltransferase
MYEYFHGMIIREGADGLNGNYIKNLFYDAGWIIPSQPKWQDEKYEICFKNSTWVYTVWHNEEMIAMVRVVSDKVMTATIQDLIVDKKYHRQGIGKKLIELCLQKLPHGNWWAHTTPENYDFYRKCGFDIPNSEKSDTLTFMGFAKSKIDGQR